MEEGSGQSKFEQRVIEPEEAGLVGQGDQTGKIPVSIKGKLCQTVE
jgi:hypothetical protein